MKKSKIEHPQYTAQAEKYTLWRSLAQGGPAIERRQEFLPRHPFETDRQFSIRLARSCYRNFSAPVVSAFTSGVWRYPPVREWVPGEMGATPPDWLRPIMEDVDRCGATADKFFARISRMAAEQGVAFVQVDQPPAESEVKHLAAKTAAGLRPYMVGLSADMVIDWAFARDGGLAYAVIRQEVEASAVPGQGHDMRQEYMVWTRTGWQRWVEDGNEDDLILEDAKPHGLGRVPLVPFYFEEQSLFVGRSALADIDSLCLRVYWRDSELDKAQFDACVPIAVFSGFREEEVNSFVRASSSGLISDNTEARLVYAEPAGTSLERIRAAILDDERSIREIALRMIRPDSRAAESAEAKRLDRQQLNSRMSSFAANCGRSEEEVWRLVAAWEGETLPDVKITYNQDYDDDDMASDMLSALGALVREGTISRQTFWDAVNQGELSEIDPEVEQERLTKESYQSGPLQGQAGGFLPRPPLQGQQDQNPGPVIGQPPGRVSS